MKTYAAMFCLICIILLSGYILNHDQQQTDASVNVDQIDIKSSTMTIEEVDADGTLYRIDITSPEELEERPYIDYNVKVKLQTVVLRELDRDSIINMIREECPEDITSITVQFE